MTRRQHMSATRSATQPSRFFWRIWRTTMRPSRARSALDLDARWRCSQRTARLSGSGSNSDVQFPGNLAGVKHAVTALCVTHSNVLPVVDVNCGLEGRDPGGVTADVQDLVSQVKNIRPGTAINLRGQSQAIREAFGDMAKGLILAIVLVYLLMAINYQSWLDPLLIMMALPGAFAGVLRMLVITHTTLNVESLIGAIMAVVWPPRTAIC
jgi:multidrug efflux pump subunit AcrB